MAQFENLLCNQSYSTIPNIYQSNINIKSNSNKNYLHIYNLIQYRLKNKTYRQLFNNGLKMFEVENLTQNNLLYLDMLITNIINYVIPNVNFPDGHREYYQLQVKLEILNSFNKEEF